MTLTLLPFLVDQEEANMLGREKAFCMENNKKCSEEIIKIFEPNLKLKSRIYANEMIFFHNKDGFILSYASRYSQQVSVRCGYMLLSIHHLLAFECTLISCMEFNVQNHSWLKGFLYHST